MRDPGQIRAIQCTQCGAGLDVLGGGRVTTHVCPYCGSALDALDNYRVLTRFTEMTRPATPLSIGDRGRVMGQDWQVIGILGLSERWQTQVWTWVDHLLYSPTHGYVWLTLEDGHLILTRRWRKAVSPGWISAAQVEQANARPGADSDGEHFRYFETSTASITFAEGEFTWRPRQDDRTITVSLLGDRTMLSYVEGAHEREIERSWYLPQADVWAAFGVTGAAVPRTEGAHPLAPVRLPRDLSFLIGASAVFAALCGLLALVFLAMNGRTVLAQTTLRASQLPTEMAFDIADTSRLAELRFEGDLGTNTWAWIEVTLSDPEDVPLFEAGRELGYYAGRDSDGAWTEDDRVTVIRFHPTQSGRYTLDLDAPEGGAGEAQDGPRLGGLRVSAREGASSARPPLALAVLFALLAGGLVLWRRTAEARRWQGSDWEDDD
ncbi:MAG: DUF4178 domain-containing protein [Rhodobacter sp.]|uniref:DUF4178 domain-containing protein n=1 Tax=Pararhodobacter sp. TaxID=2127056 RepID=UPI001E0687BB|nr:DUF4178 domain-containing protein [Pararhodobacter sp.]MCB1343945.1 DUF4178 domain-containing protein [Paracoccaceae bacterium]MCC0074295.1 DUF4178 domain-containing protein [Rhodobacter sp.]HPD91626.1 DUF4178 domain-containing protein [Pararhodobacter sp.]